MVTTFKNAKWIWTSREHGIDEYGDFYSEFEFTGKKTELLISADTNYAVYLNGELCTFGQYSDYPYDKVFDTVDITSFCKEGKNSVAIVVWYLGIDTTQVYYPGNAALMFEVFSDGVSVLSSSEKTLCRKSIAYAHHKNKRITIQMGPSFEYDATKEDSWMLGELSGNFEGQFWVQVEGRRFELITDIYVIDAMDGKTKKGFIAVSTKKKNAAAKGIMGKIRDVVENMMYPENALYSADYISSELESDVMMDQEEKKQSDKALTAEELVDSIMIGDCWSLNQYKAKQRKNPEPWDEIEKSIIANIADDVTVSVKGKNVEIKVTKDFE